MQSGISSDSIECNFAKKEMGVELYGRCATDGQPA